MLVIKTNPQLIHEGSRVHCDIYVIVKSVESKVPTAIAYDVARSSVGCQLRCRPRHLTAVLNYEASCQYPSCSSSATLNQPKPNQVTQNRLHPLHWLFILYSFQSFSSVQCVFLTVPKYHAFIYETIAISHTLKKVYSKKL